MLTEARQGQNKDLCCVVLCCSRVFVGRQGPIVLIAIDLFVQRWLEINKKSVVKETIKRDIDKDGIIC